MISCHYIHTNLFYTFASLALLRSGWLLFLKLTFSRISALILFFYPLTPPPSPLYHTQRPPFPSTPSTGSLWTSFELAPILSVHKTTERIRSRVAISLVTMQPAHVFSGISIPPIPQQRRNVAYDRRL